MRRGERVDLFKLHKEEYAAPKAPVLVRVKPGSYLSIEGQGAPGGEEFSAKIGALYSAAYTIKMTRKFAGQQDYVIGKLEGQWWGEGGEMDLSKVPAGKWCWRLLIRTPDFVTKEELKRAASVLEEKGKGAQVQEVRLERLGEGDCVQMLHVGPYEREGETIAQMKAFAQGQGWAPAGKHHEIYLSDPRRVAPERLRTILRMPVARRTRRTE